MSQLKDPASITSDVNPNATVLRHLLNKSRVITSPALVVTMPVSEHGSLESTEPSFQVIVPTIAHPEQYDYLPGHFEALRILAVDMHEPKFIVRLKSGERTTVTAEKLMRLSNGPQVIREFIDGSQSPDPLAMNFESKSNLADAQGDATHDSGGELETTIGLARNRQRRRGATSTSLAHFFDPNTIFEDAVEESSSEEDEDSPESTAESSIELGSDSEEEVRPNTRRHLKRGVRKTRSNLRELSDDTFASNRATRSSARTRKSTRHNLRERLEDDDLSEVEVVKPKQKYSGAKEHFIELPEDDAFRASHSENCSHCGKWEEEDSEEGPLIFCQGCTSSYHRDCLGSRRNRKHLVTKIAPGNFILQCANCLGLKHQSHDILPHLGQCATCAEAGPMSMPLRKSHTPQEEQQLREQNGGIDPVTDVDMSRVNNVENVLIRCVRCKRASHVEHLLSDQSQDRSDISAESWRCIECHEAPSETSPIEVIVAWRPKNADVKVIPQLVEMLPETEKEYLIKWAKKSYFRVAWMPGDWVWCMTPSRMLKAFLESAKSNNPIMITEEAVPKENLLIDILFDVEYIREPKSAKERAKPELVKSAFVKFQGLPYEDTVWEDPPEQSNVDQWNAFKTALADKVYGESIELPDIKALKKRLKEARAQNFGKKVVLESQPKMLVDVELMDYQLDGVNWLYYMFWQKTNAILADDMGLGKTLQIIGLFAALIENFECFPFLVVVPNSTVPNWRREIKRFAPKVRVVTYFGSAWARGMAESHEMFQDGELCCHVVIASYESMADQSSSGVLGKIPWAGLVVDEGQRLKNDQSLLYNRLKRMKFGFKALLTGTPLQNNIRELFNLIQFIDPTKDAEKLEERYGGDLTKDDIRELHDMIRPCFLRRTKGEVLPFLPPMVQIIIPVTMSVVQKKLYKSILEKNPTLIKAILKKKTGQVKSKDRQNLNNILIQLRKCLCHPFVYNRDIEEQTLDSELAQQRLVEASGKLQLLKLMLPQLEQRGHRVLIFSQFLENLDIVEDFLVGLKLEYCRLDGRMNSSDKQKQIDRFNAPDSPVFAFLLSTRSGGVGINLATADTVIIMDPDFNPKQDMQALSRAHRIGQKNVVLVFHLVVRGSVEEKIMQKGKTKMALDHVLIDRIEADEDEEDLESILQHGAQALFNNDDSADIKYDAQSISKLLDRSQAEKAEESAQEGDANTKSEGQFNFARVWQMDRDSLEEVAETEEAPVDVSAWENILLEREREAQEELNRKAEGLGRGKRKRATISYNTKMPADDDDDNDEAGPSSPLKSPPAKMQKTTADHEYRQPEDEGEETESDPDATLDDNVAELDEDPNASTEVTQQPPTAQYYPAWFDRAPRPISPPVSSPPPTDGSTDNYLRPCEACGKPHLRLNCPLYLAGFELCGLCGNAHFAGGRRNCPAMRSTHHCRKMIEALALSNDDPVLVAKARRLAQGYIVGNNAVERRRVAREAAAEAGTQTSPAPSSSKPAEDSGATDPSQLLELI
ncbi:SNF2-related protein [Penicillium brevicompactum]